MEISRAQKSRAITIANLPRKISCSHVALNNSWFYTNNAIVNEMITVEYTLHHSNVLYSHIRGIKLPFRMAGLLVEQYNTFREVVCKTRNECILLAKITTIFSQMLTWPKISSDSINIFNIVTNVVALYKLYQATSHEPSFTFLA